MFIHKMRRWGLAHTHLDDVLAHIKETLYCYPWMKSEPVTNLLNFAGDVYYIYKGKYFKAFITIYLPESYPNDPPQAWVVCEDGTTAIDPVQMHVAPNGSVSIPYLWDWDGKSSTLLQFILHMSVEFTSQPPTFAIDVGINLSPNQFFFFKFHFLYCDWFLWALSSKSFFVEGVIEDHTRLQDHASLR